VRTAQKYLRLAEGWEELEAKVPSTALLSIEDGLRLLAEPKEATPLRIEARQIVVEPIRGEVMPRMARPEEVRREQPTPVRLKGARSLLHEQNAIHEAGHAVVAYWAGWPIQSVRVTDNLLEGGRVRYVRAGAPAERAMVALAGEVGHEVFYNRPLRSLKALREGEDLTFVKEGCVRDHQDFCRAQDQAAGSETWSNSTRGSWRHFVTNRTRDLLSLSPFREAVADLATLLLKQVETPGKDVMAFLDRKVGPSRKRDAPQPKPTRKRS
jgi:hypothetical protein